MRKQIYLIIGLFTLLAVGLIPASFASQASTRYSWMMCTAQTGYGHETITANIGQDSVLVSWNVPTASYENEFGCTRFALSDVSITVVVNHPGSVGIPYSSASPYPNSASTFPLKIEFCGIHGCTFPTPYYLQYGDQIITSINACYNGIFCHGTNFNLKVTS